MPGCAKLGPMKRAHITLLAAVASLCAPAAAQTQPEPTRGRLLYATHCIECHDSQVHWRDGKLANDWGSLTAQVRRWQARALLNWSEPDIVEVSRHLNDTIYRFAPPPATVGMATDTGAARGR
jgi:mono/diheme cytochrome c family protein